MTGARIASARSRYKGLGRGPRSKTSDEVVPGWYSPSPVLPEQAAAARQVLARNDALELAPMLGLAEVTG